MTRKYLIFFYLAVLIGLAYAQPDDEDTAESQAQKLSDASEGEAAVDSEKNVLWQVHPYIFNVNNYSDFKNGT